MSLSLEFFPPKDEVSERRFWRSLDRLSALSPDFVSVTYGAGGTTQTRTLDAVARIAAHTPLRPAAHLTCVGKSRAEVDAIADQFWEAGVRHIVALRGDPAGGIGAHYTPREEGYAYGSDLAAGLKSRHDFEISVSAYPELHPESGSWDAELDNLRRKVDAGASRAITQFFFAPETFFRFRDRVSAARINIALVPGIMLQRNFLGLTHMADLCGVNVPSYIATQYASIAKDGTKDGTKDGAKDAKARKALTTRLAQSLITDLQAGGVDDFHLYTLNRADIALALAPLFDQAARKATA